MPKRKSYKRRWSAMKLAYQLYRVKEFGVIQSSVIAVGIFFSLDDYTECQLQIKAKDTQE